MLLRLKTASKARAYLYFQYLARDHQMPADP